MIWDFDSIFKLPPFGLKQKEKDELFEGVLAALTEHHRKHCEPYRRITDMAGPEAPLPVRLFKRHELLSVPREEIVQITTSSGTTGQAVSRIFLDRDTSIRQRRSLARIVSDFTGNERMPMLIIDSPAVTKERGLLSARGAGILGFAMLGRDLTYALDENMELDMPAIEAFLEKHREEKILLFGMTYIVWLHFCQALRQKRVKLDIEGILIHGGGWKKLSDEDISREQFKASLYETAGIESVSDYYGMIEQTGSIFMECEYGRLHASIFSDVSIVDPRRMRETAGGRGLVQTDSLIPSSYPGHRILNEDEGELIGIDDCPCGRMGKTFKVYGRVQGAEIRGCSNSYERR